VSLSKELKQVFEQFISSNVSKDSLRNLASEVGSDDIEALIDAVNILDDPSEYCQDDYDEKTVAGFFLFIDFISALIINLGAPAIEVASKYSSSKHPYVPWVAKYASEPRFHGEILEKFSDIF